MTRHNGLATIGFGLCIALAPGCNRSLKVPHGSHPSPGPATHAPPPGPLPTGNDSPYCPLQPSPPTPLPEPAKDGPLNQARKPAPPPQPDLKLPPVQPTLPKEPANTLRPVAATDPVPDAPLVEALRCYLDKRPGEALEYLEGFDKPNQELLLCLLPLAVRLTQGSLAKADPQQMAVVVDQLTSLTEPLRPRAGLVIDKVCLCDWIWKFGSFRPLPPDRPFHPGDLVNVYVEVRNCSNERLEHTFVTRLAGTIQIKSYDGQTLVWREDMPDRHRPEVFHSLRHDYYTHYRFKLPDIPPGPYTLWVTITDLPTGRVARRSVDLRVAARSW